MVLEGTTALQSGSQSPCMWQGHCYGSTDRMKPVVGVFGEPSATLQGDEEKSLKWSFCRCMVLASVTGIVPSANC